MNELQYINLCPVNVGLRLNVYEYFIFSLVVLLDCHYILNWASLC